MICAFTELKSFEVGGRLSTGASAFGVVQESQVDQIGGGGWMEAGVWPRAGDESEKEENDGEGHGGDRPVLSGPLSPPG